MRVEFACLSRMSAHVREKLVLLPGFPDLSQVDRVRAVINCLVIRRDDEPAFRVRILWEFCVRDVALRDLLRVPSRPRQQLIAALEGFSVGNLTAEAVADVPGSVCVSKIEADAGREVLQRSVKLRQTTRRQNRQNRPERAWI